GREWGRGAGGGGAFGGPATATTMAKAATIMRNERHPLPQLSLLRLLSWLSPAFPSGSYVYSHGLEWAVEAGDVDDRETLVEWLGSDLRHGSGRNEAIFFVQAWRSGVRHDQAKPFEITELTGALPGTREFPPATSPHGSR